MLEIGDEIDLWFDEFEGLPYFIAELSEGYYFIYVEIDESRLYHVR